MAKAPLINPHAPIYSDEAHTRIQNARGERLDEHGKEIVSPLPMQPPLGYKRQDPLAIRIREMIIGEKLRQAAIDAGMETFEEADDFDVDDDFDPSTPYENDFDPPLKELKKELEEIANAKAPLEAKQEAARRAAAEHGTQLRSPETVSQPAQTSPGQIPGEPLKAPISTSQKK